MFPDVDLAGMLIVPTCQQADYDLVRTGEKIDTEKDRLLERVRPAATACGTCAASAATNASAADVGGCQVG